MGKQAPEYRSGRAICRPRPLGLSCVELSKNGPNSGHRMGSKGASYEVTGTTEQMGTS